MANIRKHNRPITQKNVRCYLNYDLNTGLFTRKIATARRTKIGDIAGSGNSGGYILIRFLGKKEKAHRLAFYYVLGYCPEEVDHINHIRSDNRWVNLRPVNRKINQKNKSKYKNNTSGTTGVFWNKKNKKWVAKIFINKKWLQLGAFNNKQDAITARKTAEITHGFHENHGK